MQQYTSYPDVSPRCGKRFLHMIAGLICAVCYGALWLGIICQQPRLLFIGICGILLSLVHILVGHRRAMRSFQRAAAKEREERMKQEILCLAKQHAIRHTYARYHRGHYRSRNERAHGVPQPSSDEESGN